jgi:hypothetical protein
MMAVGTPAAAAPVRITYYNARAVEEMRLSLTDTVMNVGC